MTDDNEPVDRRPHTERRRDKILAETKAAEARDKKIADLEAQVASLAEKVQQPPPNGGEPEKPPSHPPVRWHELAGEERDAELEELRTWMRNVWFPEFPGDARVLADKDCWAQHGTVLHALTTARQTWELCWGPGSGPASRAQWMWTWRKAMIADIRDALSGCTESAGHNDNIPKLSVIDGVKPKRQETGV